jgi:SPP1 gp7 family putative phage head morphogenesis protein
MSKKDYWAERMAKSQDRASRKSLNQIKAQFRKYYSTAAKYVVNDFVNTYEKLLNDLEQGREATPADLYKLDKYWQLQGSMRQQLQKLGEKSISMLTKNFETNFFEVYYGLPIQGKRAFNTLDTSIVKQMINGIWCADGKSWSSRIWGNTEKLAETLNEELIQNVLAGKKTSELKKKLQERFSVSFNNADMIARTELAHIQTQAAKKRYEDYGIQEVEIWADEDERRCEICGKLHQKRYPIGANVPIPAHPRCRCCIVPVVEKNNKKLGESD